MSGKDEIPGDLVFRPARPEDASAIAKVLRVSMSEAMPYLPNLHTPEADLWFVTHRVIPTMETDVVVTSEEGRIVGFCAVSHGWVEQLYLLPDVQGRRIGTALIKRAMARWDHLRLWTFQRNHAARRFYESFGFAAVEETDGSRNEKREPDVLYEWRRERSG